MRYANFANPTHQMVAQLPRGNMCDLSNNDPKHIPRYLLVYLCDNDYSEPLRHALSHWISEGKAEDILHLDKLRSQLIALIVGFAIFRSSNADRADYERVYTYLREKLKVIATDNLPQLPDHDNSSAGYDRVTRYTWRF